LGREFVRRGSFISPAAISQINTAASRSDVLDLLGAPGDESSDEWWFYNVNLPVGNAGDYLVCQYRVAFDGLDQVVAADWRRPQCQSRYNELLQPDVQEITLSSDVLFGYDSAEISLEGKTELDVAASVVVEKIKLDRVLVVGHTDRIGPDAYNVSLSKRRADAVRNYLVSQGVPDYLVTAEGRGAAEPVVVCDGTRVTAALKSCLQPNRRVQITIHGQR
jgi:outer membrane protein OmpA-like peptidoglycan-associated protein